MMVITFYMTDYNALVFYWTVPFARMANKLR